MALSNLFGWKKIRNRSWFSMRSSVWSSRQTSGETGSMRNSMWSSRQAGRLKSSGDDCFERTGAERRQPAACGTACGAADKPAEKPAACGTACGASDK